MLSDLVAPLTVAAVLCVGLVVVAHDRRADNAVLQQGLERVVFLFLKLGNIRWATMFPRDPRSFPMDARRQALAMQPSDLMKRGPVADTLEYAEKKNAGKQPPLPKLEDLIAAYGDSPNTSWLDPFWTVVRVFLFCLPALREAFSNQMHLLHSGGTKRLEAPSVMPPAKSLPSAGVALCAPTDSS